MRRALIFAAVISLSSCHSLKKVTQENRTSQVTAIGKQHGHTSMLQSVDNQDAIAIELNKEFKDIAQLSGSVTEKFDTSGRVTERTTTFTHQNKHHEKQKKKQQANTQAKKKVAQNTAQAVHIETKEDTRQDVHKEVKRTRMAIWFWLSGILLAAGFILRYRKWIIKNIIGLT